MEIERKDDYTVGELVGKIKSLLRYIISKRLLILFFAIVGIAVGVILNKIQKPKYEAISTFILEEKQPGAGLGGVASQFGIDLGSLSGGGSIFSGDNILDILRSKTVVTEVLLSSLSTGSDSSNKLIDLYLDFSDLKNKWKGKIELANISFKNVSERLTPIQDSVLDIVYKKIIKNNLSADRISKKGTIISVQVASENSTFSKYMSERLVDDASKMYLNIKTGTAQANINRLQRRSDSLLFLLNSKSYQTAASQPLDVNPGIKTAIVPVEIASRDKTVIAALYSEVTKNLEVSKMMLAQQTPVMQILDRPGLTLDDHKKGMVFFIAISLLVSVILIFAFLTLFFFARHL